MRVLSVKTKTCLKGEAVVLTKEVLGNSFLHRQNFDHDSLTS